MEKVKLPRDVADTIEKLRGVNTSNQDILYKFAWDTENGYPELVSYAAYYFDTFISAIVNGYEVEETPEEKIWNFYHTKAACDMHPHHAIQHVLNILNIKIDGVNN